MDFASPLIPATLIRRYKRFLADVRLDDGTEMTVHCANPGSMLGLQDEGLRIWLEDSRNPKRKLRYSWKLIELPGGHMAGIDTALPNRIVGAALRGGQIAGLSGYDDLRAEVKYGRKSRVDFLLSGKGRPDAFVEVKNVTLRRDGDWAEFPDSVTARGARHLEELSEMVRQGHRAVMFYLVQRTDCARLCLARDLDPAYAAAFDAARRAGVEVLAHGTRISPGGIALGAALPFFDQR